MALMLTAVTVGDLRAEEPPIARTWYRGDLHAHSLHSDGDSTVAEVIANAEQQELDFFALTDHDGNMNGNPTHWHDPDYQSDRMVLLYGIEWTNSKGHANVWAETPFPYEELWQANQDNDVARAVALAHSYGAIFSINHPEAVATRTWQYPIDEDVDSVEVWNAMYRLPNFNFRSEHVFWEATLALGRRMPAVGGSDNHDLKGFQSLFLNHGNPTTWVCAEECTARAILDGIAAGHVTLSYAPDAPRLEIEADVDGDGVYETMSGDNLDPADRPVEFRIELVEPAPVCRVPAPSTSSQAIEIGPLTLEGLRSGRIAPADLTGPSTEATRSGGRSRGPGQIVVVFKNGDVFRAWVVFGRTPTIRFRDVPESLSYYRVELRGDPDVEPNIADLVYGRVLALTNPIYVDFPE